MRFLIGGEEKIYLLFEEDFYRTLKRHFIGFKETKNILEFLALLTNLSSFVLSISDFR